MRKYLAAKPDRQSLVMVTQQSDPGVLQRAYDDRVVTRLIQAKLTVGPVGDRYEREAHRVAAQVMSIPAPAMGQRGRRAGKQGRVVRFRDRAIIGLAERRRD